MRSSCSMTFERLMVPLYESMYSISSVSSLFFLIWNSRERLWSSTVFSSIPSLGMESCVWRELKIHRIQYSSRTSLICISRGCVQMTSSNVSTGISWLNWNSSIVPTGEWRSVEMSIVKRDILFEEIEIIMFCIFLEFTNFIFRRKSYSDRTFSTIKINNVSQGCTNFIRKSSL